MTEYKAKVFLKIIPQKREVYFMYKFLQESIYKTLSQLLDFLNKEPVKESILA